MEEEEYYTEEVNYSAKQKFSIEVENLYRLHYVTQIKHSIEYDSNWLLFEPTKFVYAFFAFNTCYNYDWEESIKQQKIIFHSNDKYESEKYNALIDFIFKIDVGRLLKADFVNYIRTEYSKKYLQSEVNTRKITDNILNDISNITVDYNVNNDIKSNFLSSLSALLFNIEKLDAYMLKNRFMPLIYKVRNNIFHGDKDIINMKDPSQRRRLDIYASIIIAINDLLFKTLNKKYNINFHKNFRFVINPAELNIT